MEVEYEPLIEEKGELNHPASFSHTRKGVKARSWIRTISTHTLVAVFTLLLLAFLNGQGVVLRLNP